MRDKNRIALFSLVARAVCILTLATLLPLLTSCIAGRALNAGPATIQSFSVSLPGGGTAPNFISTPGKPVVLSWVVSGAVKVTISDGSGMVTDAVPVSSNSVQVSPMVTTTYTLTAVGGDGSSISTVNTSGSGGGTPAAVTVNIVYPPAFSAFSASTSTIALGQDTTLTWSVTNATSLTLNSTPQGSIITSAQDVTGLTSLVVHPAATTTYYLQAVNSAVTGSSAVNSSNLTITVEQIPLPVISSFAATKTSIVTGGYSVLTWSELNATKLTVQAVNADNPAPGQQTDVTGDTNDAGQGSLQVTPSEKTTYTLVAANSAGLTTMSQPVVITPSSCPPPDILSFVANPVSTGSGNPVMLNAIFDGGPSTGTGNGTIDNGIGAVTSGEPATTSSLNASTTFNLSVTNTCNSNNTASVRVPVGSVNLFAGQTAGHGNQDGQGAAAAFWAPTGLATDSSGNVYVADTYNGTIRMITPAGEVSTIAGIAGQYGNVDGPLGTGLLANPLWLAVDTAGNVFVADSGINNSFAPPPTLIEIREISAGTHILTTLAGGAPGYLDGTGPNALFSNLGGLAVDAQDNIYVTDQGNNLIRLVTPAGVVTTLAGSPPVGGAASGGGFSDGAGTNAAFDKPTGIVLAPDGSLYVADTGNFAVRKVTTSGVVTTIAGTPKTSGDVDGPASSAQFGRLASIAVDPSGTFYVGDVTNEVVRRITLFQDSYIVDTIAGGGQLPVGGALPGTVGQTSGLIAVPSSSTLFFSTNNSVYSAPY